MKTIIENLWRRALPYLDTRANDIHTRICVRFAYELLRREGGDESIVIPAVILHDVGWKRVPENRQLEAFGPRATSPELNRIHEKEGALIATGILKELGLQEPKTTEITVIIERHDSGERPTTLNERIVKDADKLWRYSREGLKIDTERFGETVEEGLERLRTNLEKWFFTGAAREIAMQELAGRVKEAKRAYSLLI
jgi:HD superfamily phosphodiesterase